MANAPQQMSPAQMMQQNMTLRQALLASAPRMRKIIANLSGQTLGSTSRVKLFNVGITTGLKLNVSVTFDIGTAVATPSPKAPFNLINRVKVLDFDGTDRVNCSGYQLWVVNSVRAKTVYGYNNASQTSVLGSPSVPTSVGTGQVMNFQIDVPLAYNSANDLRGALLTQTAVGEAYISIDWNTALITNGNADFPYTNSSSVMSNATIAVEVVQEYLLPQSVGGQVPLPPLDLMTVYELAGAVRSSDNISVNSEKLINYPNVRSVIGSYFNYLNGGTFNPATTDMSKFRLIANGNNVLREYSPTGKLFDQRLWMSDHSDLRAGTYFELHREKPIETALFGNVQYGITPATVGAAATTNFEIMFESFYTKGSQLPGLSQASG